MKDFPCPICGSEEFKVMWPDTLQGKLPSFDYNFTKNYNSTYRMLRCKICTHTYGSPRPSNLWSQYITDRPDPIYLKNEEQRVETGKADIKFLRKYKKSGKLLDVGCATGDFLSVAKKYYEVEGLELSKWASNIATRKGFVIHQKILQDMVVPNSYDIITLWGVIEHFEYPKDEIKNIYRILRKGGIVCVWTPDVGSLLANILGKNWWNHQGQHIQMFTKESMRKLFEDLGFTTEFIGLYPYSVTASSLANSLSRYPAISQIAAPFLKNKALSGLSFTLKIPGEMFAIFKR